MTNRTHISTLNNVAQTRGHNFALLCATLRLGRVLTPEEVEEFKKKYQKNEKRTSTL